MTKITSKVYINVGRFGVSMAPFLFIALVILRLFLSTLHNSKTKKMAHPADVQLLNKALSGIGVDEKSLISILTKTHHEHKRFIRKGCSQFFIEDERQFERWDDSAIKNLKVEFKRFKDAVMLSLMHPWERDARLLKKALKKGPQLYGVIVEIACTRSSDELLGARKAYHSLFERSIEEDLATHVKGTERKLLVALVSAYRYEGPKVKEDTAKSEAKELLQAINNRDKRKPIEDEEVIRILTTRSKPHLREVYQQYKKISGKTITEGLEAEILLKETIECLCTPHTYFTKVFETALREDANEDDKKALTRLVSTQEAGNLKGISDKFAHKIEERVKGAYKDVLLGVLAKGQMSGQA
ncbi:annexin D4-like [Durio zibethinus]|uniref:Annexin D4-like n=1 Tax=Durio zibethinus TaxID=66656 RepID=A0A6P5YVL4_DURZI|nr:annexin D4-like [Durio zibethinus]